MLQLTRSSITKIAGQYWVPLEAAKPRILKGLCLPIKGWQWYRDENGAVVTMAEKAMVEPLPVICKCGCGYDPFYIRDFLKQADPNALCSICLDKGVKTKLRSLVLNPV